MLKCIGWSCVAGLLLAAGGCSGDKGDTGATGAAGDTGPAGAGGATGSAGAAGATGPAGPAGGAGPTGEGGAPGTSPEAGAGTSTPGSRPAAFATATKNQARRRRLRRRISRSTTILRRIRLRRTWPRSRRGSRLPARRRSTTSRPRSTRPTTSRPSPAGRTCSTANATAMAAGNLDVGGLDAQFNPFRLAPKQAFTSDQSHDYMPEQLAADGTKIKYLPGVLPGRRTPPLPRSAIPPRWPRRR